MSDEKPETFKHIVIVEVEVPVENWIDYLTKHPDIFGTPHYCGYWMRGVERDDELGWLCWEHGDDYAPFDKEPNHKKAIKAWRTGKALPENWHRLDKAAAIRRTAKASSAGASSGWTARTATGRATTWSCSSRCSAKFGTAERT